MKQMGQDGKCGDTAEKEFKLAGYENWPGYKSGRRFIARRYCGLWGRGTSDDARSSSVRSRQPAMTWTGRPSGGLTVGVGTVKVCAASMWYARCADCSQR
jgi:hypothetical protein